MEIPLEVGRRMRKITPERQNRKATGDMMIETKTLAQQQNSSGESKKLGNRSACHHRH